MMADPADSMPAIYAGWENYQRLIVTALRPLTAEQLELNVAPNLRTINQIARHVIGARARWFHSLMGEGGEAFEAFSQWDRAGQPARSAAELTEALEATWQGMQAAIRRWSPADWQKTWPGEEPDDPEVFTRHWVIWHLIEHDIHHGGEISLTLGRHGLPAPNL